jgi:hypothetical protein
MTNPIEKTDQHRGGMLSFDGAGIILSVRTINLMMSPAITRLPTCLAKVGAGGSTRIRLGIGDVRQPPCQS